MRITCCFFEDHYLEKFHPLTLTRPLYDLRIGIFTLGEKWIYALENTGKPVGPVREHLRGVFDDVVVPDDSKEVLWINPRFIPTEELIKKIKSLKTGESIITDSQLIAALITPKTHEKWMKKGISNKDLNTIEVPVDDLVVLKNIWELFQYNGTEISSDIDLLNASPLNEPADYPHATFVNPGRIYIEEGATIEAGAMLLAYKGPIYIGKYAHIMANSVVRGPSAICDHSVVKMGAKIYEDTTIGPVCKVGGEVSNVIFHSYSNKGHDGYAGNSVFGQWCNLGADTNTSNLKNNYSTVKVTDWKTSKEMDTGQQFIGTIMGDHSKTGINSMLNTGTLCGVCCNLFSDGYPPKFVPSFSWVSGHDIVPYHFEKAIEAMERMMERRDVVLTPAYKSMMKALFDSTSF